MRFSRVIGSVMDRLPFRRCISIFTSALFLAAIQCSPMRGIKRVPVYEDSVISNLTNYGYLPMSDIETGAGNLRTEDQLRLAIKEFQKFGNIPATGEVDEDTLQLLRRPRCGLPDVQSTQHGSIRKKRYVLHGGPKWSTTNLTWSLRSKNIQNLDFGHVRHALHKALEVWAKNSRLTFTEVNSDSADILVYFERGYHNDGFPFDGRGQVLAHAFFPGSGRGGDAHFDEEEMWVLDINSEEGGTSLFAVAAHEFGHSLGLSHSSVSGSLMFPWYQGLKANFELPDDDREAIQVLYGAKESGRYPSYIPERPRDKPTKYPPYQPPRYPPVDTPRQYPPYEPPKYNPPYQPPPTPPKPPVQPPHHRPSSPDQVPNTCDTSYDAISVIRGELFIFKDKYVWRIGDKGLYQGYPTLIERLWSSLSRVDAVYERYDGKIMFFVGREVYLFHGNTLLNSYPRPLTSLGLPHSLDHIDAVMIWGHNSKTYLFSGTMYWRLDDETGRVLLDYPVDIMRVWKGVGYNIDAAFQWKDGATYFFKGKGFWKLDDTKMRITNPQQNLSAPVWMGCPKALADPRLTEAVSADRDSVDIHNISKDGIFSISVFAVIAAVAVCILILIAVVMIIIRRRKTHCYTRPKRFGR